MIHLSYTGKPGGKEAIPANVVESGGRFPPKGENVCMN